MYTRGSEWRKWDLHIHTPCSLVQEYGGDTPAAWERFIAELERLPEEFAVIGINDYIFIDGYRKVLEAREHGRLGNIRLVLPVIELRLDKFGGSASHLSRVNYHVIFSDEIPPDVIEQQFLNALSSKYQLSPQGRRDNIAWSGVPTRESLTDLGNRIRDSVPDGQKHRFTEPLKEGFNHLNLHLPDVREILEREYFKGKVLTAVGKAEWDQIKWNDHSVADKRDVINSAHFVFISADSPEAHARAKDGLTNGGVNDRLLDCSDAHRFSDANDKDRIGKCFTWIKADPTFRGLEQAVHETAERIYVGEVPPQFLAVKGSPTKYMRGLAASKIAGSRLDEPWFDGVSIPFNPGLVAVIGNKGSGKSALIDILGLLGDSHNQSKASFLSKDRFNPVRQPKGGQFEAMLEWASGSTATKRLNDTATAGAVERVKYIPQSFFEVVCNEITGGDGSAFDDEIKDVIFSHVPADARLGKASLSDLITYRTAEISRSIDPLKADISRLNRRLLDLRSRETAEYLNRLQTQMQAKRAEMDAHEANKPTPVAPPGEAGDAAARVDARRIEEARGRLRELDEAIGAAQEEQKRLAMLIGAVERAGQMVKNIRTEMEKLVKGLADELVPVEIDADTVVRFEIDEAPILAKGEDLRKQKQHADAILDAEQPASLPNQRNAVLKEIDDIKARLDEPGKLYEAFRKALREWEEGASRIRGAADMPGSLLYFEGQIDRWSDIPHEIEDVDAERAATIRKLFGKLSEIRDVYADLYRPVQDFIAGHAIAKDFRLNFDVSIALQGFADRFLTFINHGVSGSFCGRDAGTALLGDVIAGSTFDTEDGVLEFLAAIEERLRRDHRKTPADAVELQRQLRAGVSAEDLYDFLFGLEYLVPRYRLQMAGKGLDQLSPGEKGSLLLVFYLLVDRNDVPLIIDQPEENLDNQSIVSLLVPSIKEAKTRRQIVIVTHNPNIAVVCDAEQIVAASHESDTKTVSYLCGSIEDPAINKKVMDILEGTKPAFDNRSAKYGIL